MKHLTTTGKLASVLAVLALVGVAVVAASSRLGSNAREKWIAIEPPSAEKQILFNGVIDGINSSIVRAPFESSTTQVHAALGDRVQAGDKLLDLDPSALQLQLLEAQEAMLRSEIAFNEAASWSESVSYRAALRQQRIDKDALKLAEQKMVDSGRLFKAGIISREELNQNQQSVQSARAQLQGATDNLESFQKKARTETIRLAELDLQKHKKRLAELQRKLASARIVSPIAGVITQLGARSQTSGSEAPADRFSEGTVLAKVVDTSNFMVLGSASEAVVDKLKVDMPATVRPNSLPGVSLDGSIAKISALPAENSNRQEGGPDTRSVKFTVYVKLAPLQGSEAVQLLLGTSAEVAVSGAHVADEAVLVPLGSVHPFKGLPSIVVRSTTKPGAPAVKTVEVLDTLADGIVIKAPGVQVGDMVLANPRRATQPTGELFKSIQ